MVKFGIDISEFQKGISLKKAKKEGVTFVMLRAGYTGSSNGINKAVDSQFKTHYKNAKSAGLNVGAYWFSRATDYAKGRAEAEYMYKNCLKGKQFEYPIAIDVEDSYYQGKATKSQVTQAIKGFCEYLEAKGFWVTIYASSYWLSSKMNLNELKRYDKWVANWGKSNPKSPAHGLWQFGGETNLIRSNKIAGYVVDQNYAYKDYPTLIKQKGLNGFKASGNTPKPTVKYKTGNYKTLAVMNVRSGPGTKYSIKTVSQLTPDGKKNATSKSPKAHAAYKKGTEFTALKIEQNGKSYWAKTPSGYICLQLGNEVYCKKI